MPSTNFVLVLVPGPGARSCSLPAGSNSVATLVSREGLHDRQIIINGQGVNPSDYQTTSIPANAEVFATGSVKGN